MTSAAWILVSACAVCLLWAIGMSIAYAFSEKDRRTMARTLRRTQDRVDELKHEADRILREFKRAQFVIHEEEIVAAPR